MKYLIRFSYDGSNFHGFQRQNDVKSVQKTLEETLTKVLKTTILIKGSGRTDALVHAKDQCAHFNYNKKITKKDIKLINKLLNKEIIIKKITKVPDDFHARYSVKSKTYIYKINIKNYKEKYNNYYYQINYNLDINKMREASKVLIGTHDFHNFVSGPRDNYISTIYRIKIYKFNKIIYMKFTGKGFYRYMVRHLSGALVDVGKGKATLDTIESMINEPNTFKNLSVLPPQGLYLTKIKY